MQVTRQVILLAYINQTKSPKDVNPINLHPAVQLVLQPVVLEEKIQDMKKGLDLYHVIQISKSVFYFLTFYLECYIVTSYCVARDTRTDSLVRKVSCSLSCSRRCECSLIQIKMMSE